MMINGAATRKTRGFVWALEPGALRGTWCADFIRASGHRTAHKGRTYDRIPHRSRSPRLTLESKGPSTHDSALLTVFARRYCASADAQPRAIVEPRFAKHGMPTFRRRRSLNRCTVATHHSPTDSGDAEPLHRRTWMQRFADPPNSALTNDCNDCNGATVRKPEGAGESPADGEYGGGLPRNETERRAEQEEDEYPRDPSCSICEFATHRCRWPRVLVRLDSAFKIRS